MIPKHPLTNCFPDYDGPPGEVRPAVEYIEKKYQVRDLGCVCGTKCMWWLDCVMSKVTDITWCACVGMLQDIMERVCPGKKVYIHVIAARVRMDMKIAFGEVKETLKKITLAKKGRKK